jgi:general stress protein 26
VQDEIRSAMWKAMSHQRTLMVGLIHSADHRIPMTAQLDEDAHGHFWFYTTKDNRLASGGKAMAQFVSEKRDVLACISGTLVGETDRAVIDRYWSNEFAAWYDGGRDDPALHMLRFDLDDAEIWSIHPTIKGMFKLMTGRKVERREFSDHARVAL